MKKSVKAFETERVLVSWCQSACESGSVLSF